MKNKPASCLVVSFGKALIGTLPSLCGRQMVQTSRKWQLPSIAYTPSQRQRYNSLSRECRINMDNDNNNGNNNNNNKTGRVIIFEQNFLFCHSVMLEADPSL